MRARRRPGGIAGPAASDPEPWAELESYVPGGLVRISPEGLVRHASASFAALLGYDEAGFLVGLDLGDLCTDPGDVERLVEALERDGTVRRFVAELRRFDGAPLRVRIDGRAFRGSDGRMRYGEGLVQELDGGDGSSEPAAADPPPAAGGKPFVLVVEKDAENRSEMAAALSGQYEVLATGAPAEALDLLTRRAAGISIILMDVALIDSADARRLWKSLREREAWSHIPVIATTTRVLSESEERLWADGCNGYMVKPLRQRERFAEMEGPFRPRPVAGSRWREWERRCRRLLHRTLLR